jgi:SAM-dependent methyltransferase
MLRRSTIALMQCPSCREGPLRVRANAGDDEPVGDLVSDGTLCCDACGATYDVTSGIPSLLPRDALGGEQWDLWKRHLDGFQARRELPGRERGSVLQRATVETRGLFTTFARFTSIQRGRVLDIGCGPGTLRAHLGEAVEYHGIDPIPLPTSSEFDYAQAIAEFIPFNDTTFDHVVAISALDHFRDVDVAFSEIARVLQPGGQLHLVQSIHDVRGPLTGIKYVTHWAKDATETRATRGRTGDAPKHISEFTRRSLRDAVSERFRIENETTYSKRWYSPQNLFLTLTTR